jgi:hypothetical protein
MARIPVISDHRIDDADDTKWPKDVPYCIHDIGPAIPIHV